jgi:tetratricopeptide (TPR) repeat protein/TolB-like protein
MINWSGEIKELDRLYESFKGNLPDIEKELEQLIRTQDANVVMLYSRRCLEVIITDLCECELKRPRKTEPLKGIIDKLNSEEKVPAHIITSMHGLNSLSTYGTHPKDFDPEQVKPVLNNLAIIIRWYLKYKDSQNSGKAAQADGKHESERPAVPEKPVQFRKPNRKPLITFAGIVLTITFIVLILNFFEIFTKDKFKDIQGSDGRISIAVMPFQNMTNDSLWNIWQDGIQENLISSLSNSEDLKVRNKESVNRLLQKEAPANYASVLPSVAKIISQKLDAYVFISGSINQSGPVIRLNAQLINSKTDEVFKAFQIDGPSEELLYAVDSLSGMIMDFLVISKMVNELPVYLQHKPLTTSPEAYRCYLEGESARSKRDYVKAKKLYLQALSLDSNFTDVILVLSVACINQGAYPEGKKWSIMAYEKREQMPIRTKILINRNHAFFFETPLEEIKYLRQLLEIDDLFLGAYSDIGLAYSSLFQYEKAIPEFEKALNIYDKLDLKPWWIYNYTLLGYAYHKTGQYQKEKKLYVKAEKDFPDDPLLFHRKAVLSLTEGDTATANEYIKKYISIRKDNSGSEASITSNLAVIYSEAGIPDKAEEYYRKALSLEPNNPGRMANLSYFLIDKDRNIIEGLELVDKAIALRPEYYPYLGCKGWGLYKQGRYKEALEFLEKNRDSNLFYQQILYNQIAEVKKALAGQKNI